MLRRITLLGSINLALLGYQQNHEALQAAIFFALQLLPPSWAQVNSSTPYSHTLSTFFFPSENNFDILKRNSRSTVL
jgi:hypothetical protein